MATIRDVAELAEVHPSTVSRVLSGKAPIGAEAASRVRAAAKKLRFKPNRSARNLGLREKPPSYVAVILPRIDHPFFQRILRGLHEGLVGAGAGILVLPLEPGPAASLNLLERLEPDVLLPIGLSEELLPLMGGQSNVLWVDSIGKTPSLVVNHIAGGALAAGYLKDRGCKHPLFIGEKNPTPGQRERLLGFENAWGAPVEGWQTDQNREAVRIFVLERSALWNFDGVFCYCDEIAFGVQAALIELGRKVALVGYDGHPDSRILGLSTVAQPAEELGRRAGMAICDFLSGKGWTKRRVVLQPELIRRLS